MPNTLGLDDVLDRIEIADYIQETFDLRFSKTEAEACQTVGDVFSLIKRNINIENAGKKCANAMAFYRLRRAAISLGMSKVTPQTPLDRLPHDTAKQLFKELSKTTGLRLPRPFASWVGVFGATLVSVGFFTAFLAVVYPWVLLIAALVIASGVILFRLDPGKFSSRMNDVGTLARQTALMNLGSLIKLGALCREEDIWNAMIDILSSYSRLPSSEIRPDTLILQRQLKSA